MRFPSLNDNLNSQLNEFDIWITPSLGEISDTEKYREDLDLVAMAFEIIGQATQNFDSIGKCQPGAIAETLTMILHQKSHKERKKILHALASALFAVTGKSDNNFKCQFPLFLRDEANWNSMPIPKRSRGRIDMKYENLPRTLTTERLMSIVSLIDDPVVETKILNQFLAFMLKDQKAVRQFWALGHSYFALKQIGRERDLLAPIVIFKVRGSVMASGGHEPEKILRVLMEEWGLKADIDFNCADVLVVGAEQDPEAKTRAYDFVIPYTTPDWPTGWNNRLFIQCQFYAGDSGSVSHKNVDQTRSSRDSITRFVKSPTFIEYVDGAGYFSALNGDLKRLLAFQDTHGMIQIRSAPIRLRYYFEKIGFIPPIKIEETVALGAKNFTQLKTLLKEEGYREDEIYRAFQGCIKEGNIVKVPAGLTIMKKRMDVVRRYLLLSIAAAHSSEVNSEQLAGKVLLPGYGPFFGVNLDRLAEIAIDCSPVFRDSFSKSTSFLADLRWLSEKGYVISR